VGGEPIGYIVSAPLGPDREGEGELLVIDERHRGKSLGRALQFAEYRDYATRGALTQRSVISLRNLANLRMHGRLGFLTGSVEVWHHKWYGGSGRRAA
jgi:GNAT superfamily N-acetyltransferase